jgi:hypothetical protein
VHAPPPVPGAPAPAVAAAPPPPPKPESQIGTVSSHVDPSLIGAPPKQALTPELPVPKE